MIRNLNFDIHQFNQQVPGNDQCTDESYSVCLFLLYIEQNVRNFSSTMKWCLFVGQAAYSKPD